MSQAFVVAACAAFAVATGAAAQTCTTYPNTLTNGSTADANQVMANFNCAALLGGANFMGNVGFGTTSPQTLIDLGGALTTVKLSTWDGGGGLVYGIGVMPGALTFGAYITPTGTPQMVLTYTGLVGVGTTAPADSLDVANAVVFGAVAGGRISMFNESIGINRRVTTGQMYSTTEYGYQFQHFGSTTATSDVLALQVYNPSGSTASGGAITASGAGSVGIAAFPSTTYTFYVGGSAAGTTAWTNVSDARLKTNVREITGALELVGRLRGVRFTWLPTEQRSVGKKMTLPQGTPQIGLIAQEVASVVPEAVVAPATGSNDPYGLKEADLVPVLIQAVKEQQAEIAALRADVAALKAGR